MGLIVLGLVVLAMYLMVRALAGFSSWLARSRFRAYRTIANRYGGRYESRGLSEPPTVSFAHNGSNVRVGLAPQVPGQALGARTRVVARFRSGIPFRLELTPVLRPAPPQPPKGTRFVRVGEPEFDQGFIVQANDPEMAVAFLSAEIRRSILTLLRLAPPAGMLVSINPERMLVQIDRDLAKFPDALLVAVRESLAAHDGLRRSVASRLNEGIAIVESGATHDSEIGSPVCKVCGDPILGPAVACVVCRTPHHRDCWEFIGACSVYGCDGKQSFPS